MSKLKLAYFGDGPWSHKALVEIAERKDDFEIVFVTTRFDRRDPELCRIALDYGLEVRMFNNVNSPDALKEIQSCNLDVVVSMSFNQIFGPSFLALPRIGAVNCHAGALPRYRGRNILNWALINGETEFGVTAHLIDEGIDTGDIIHQEMVPISKGSKYGDLLELAYEACPRVLVVALDKLLNGTAVPQSQDELGLGFYCGIRGHGDEWIDWSWGAERIVNFIHAICPPGPGALTALGDQLVEVHDASFDPHSPTYICTEGEVVGRDDSGVWVKASDRVVLLERCRNSGDAKSFVPRWRIGTRLMGHQEYRLFQLEGRDKIPK